MKAHCSKTVVAGAARMNYKSFMVYNILGGVLWIASMVLFGYYVLDAADGLIQRMLGKPDFTLARHLDKVVLAVVLISVSPMLWKGYTKWRSSPRTASVGAGASK